MPTSQPVGPVRRRARSFRSPLFSRSFRPRSRQSAPTATPSVPASSSASASASSSTSVPAASAPTPTATPHPKPIYIYPGLLRVVRDKAIALDNQCPAVLYHCAQCRRASDRHSSSHPKPLSEPAAPCAHRNACAICLEEFHGKDLVRKLPCNVNHVFHSKCILDWLVNHHRCPLCNEAVMNATMHAASSPHLSELRRPRLEYARSRSHTHSHPADVRRRRTHASSAELRLTRDHRPNPHTHCPAAQRKLQPQPADKTKKKHRGPRTYSYIVHDSVRMDLDPVIPV